MAKSKLNRKKYAFSDLINTTEYWEERVKTDLFNSIFDYLEENKISQSELAKRVGCSRGYISQILNGDSDHRLSKIVSLVLAIGKAPYLHLKDLEKVKEEVSMGSDVHIDFKELEDKASYCDLQNEAFIQPEELKWTDLLDNDIFATHKSTISSLEDIHNEIDNTNVQSYTDSGAKILQFDKEKGLSNAV